MATSYSAQPLSVPQDRTSRYSPYRHPQESPPDSRPTSVVRDLFEFNGGQRISAGAARTIYAIVVVGILATWAVVTIVGFGYGPTLGVLALVLGWIPAVLWIVSARIVLEFATAIDTILERRPARYPEP